MRKNAWLGNAFILGALLVCAFSSPVLALTYYSMQVEVLDTGENPQQGIKVKVQIASESYSNEQTTGSDGIAHFNNIPLLSPSTARISVLLQGDATCTWYVFRYRLQEIGGDWSLFVDSGNLDGPGIGSVCEGTEQCGYENHVADNDTARIWTDAYVPPCTE